MTSIILPCDVTLKGCPFCGSLHVIIDIFGGERPYAASCENKTCMVIGPERVSRVEAADAWNAKMKRDE